MTPELIRADVQRAVRWAFRDLQRLPAPWFARQHRCDRGRCAVVHLDYWDAPYRAPFLT